MDATCISYKDTGFFSQTISDYLDDVPELRSFYSHRPTLEGFAELFEHKNVIADRSVLVDVLTAQYADIEQSTVVKKNIELLGNANTFTVTTGHQLNVFTGPLYFIYKIVTSITLARQLETEFPDQKFVPVYWMASEDHDFAEINHTNLGGKKISWQLEAAGATGRLNTSTIREALNQYKGGLGLEGFAPELADMVETAYTEFNKLADATRYLVNALFGQYGVIVVDADNARLKKQFASIVEQDIVEQNSYKHISATNQQLAGLDVHIQVNPREINFFYLTDTLRERITFEDNRYRVLNTDISFTVEELKTEINQYPERFSPNVVMRPLYQEVILPNVAYIGGGAEIVYWLELKANFDHYGVDFPVLILRNSGLLIKKEAAAKINKMALKTADLFKSADELKKQWINANSHHDLSLTEEWRELQCVFEKIKLRTFKIDPTLGPSTEAVSARLKHAVGNLEKKMIKAEKRNYATTLSQIEQIKNEIFPNNSLQERSQNFGSFYVKWGQAFIDELIRNFEPLDFKFTVLTE